MEPSVESIILHPAILIASGFDCLSSKQVRFLNAHRRHFHTKIYDLNQTLSITPEDLTLSGILNPFGHFHDVDTIYRKMSQSIPNFPYLSRREILSYIYKEELNNIWSEMMHELFIDLTEFCIEQKRPKDYFVSDTNVIHELYKFPIYQKITALHLCGLGGRLLDTFNYVFSRFRKYERQESSPSINIH